MVHVCTNDSEIVVNKILNQYIKSDSCLFPFMVCECVNQKEGFLEVKLPAGKEFSEVIPEISRLIKPRKYQQAFCIRMCLQILQSLTHIFLYGTWLLKRVHPSAKVPGQGLSSHF